MQQSRTISNLDDMINSSDVIARIEELLEARPLDTEDNAELNALMSLAEEGEGAADWHYGETLIRDSYFQEYAESLADELGYLEQGSQGAQPTWPFTCIDWEKAADELQTDYFSVDFDGITYWIR